MLITPEQAFDQHLRDIFITADGRVAEILPEDNIGVPHQRFLLITDSNHTVLVVYNTQHRKKLELFVGLKMHVEGTYVWNRYGGIIHETHSEINKNQPDGKIEPVFDKQ